MKTKKTEAERLTERFEELVSWILELEAKRKQVTTDLRIAKTNLAYIRKELERKG